MARALRSVETCDDCDRHEIRDTPADHTYVVSLDGGPFRAIDLCQLSDVAFRSHLVDLYERARDVSIPPEVVEQVMESFTPPELPAAEKPAKVARKKKTATRPKADPKSEPDAKDADKPVDRIVCMEAHPSTGNMPKEIAYRDRNSHVNQVHPGKRIWEVVWGDPNEVLKYPCTKHPACMKTGFSVTTPKGLAHHHRKSSLPSVDEAADA